MKKMARELAWILVIPLIFILVGESNGFTLSGDENLAKEMRSGMTEQSKLVSDAMRKSTLAMKNNIARIADTLAKRGSHNAQVKQLRDIADKLGHSADQGIVEMGGAMKDAIKQANNIANILSNKEIAKDLTNSVDKSVSELGSTIRYIGDKIVDISKQVQVRLNSSDLIQVARETKEGLVEAVNQLTTNWQVGVNTADLKDLGQAAAQELSKALQNINARVEIQFGINQEFRIAILYIAVAGGFAFAVLFVALVISLKGCRKCCVQACAALGQGIASRPENNKSNMDADVCPKEGDIVMEAIGESSPMSPKPAKQPGRSRLICELNSVLGRKNRSNNREKKETDKESNLEELSDDERLENDRRNGKKINRRFTRTLADFKDFPTLQHKWEKNARKEKRQKLRDEQILSPGKREESNLIKLV